MGHFLLQRTENPTKLSQTKRDVLFNNNKARKIPGFKLGPTGHPVSAFLHLSVQLSFPVMIVLGLRFDNKIVASSTSLTSFQVQVQNKSRKNIPSHSRKHHIAFF